MATLRSNTFNLNIQAPNGAPSWFTALTPYQWTQVGTGSLNSINPNPSPNGSGFEGAIIAWNGGAVDQVRNEFLMGANGGHPDYAGNEVFVFRLDTESPGWALLKETSTATGGSDANNGSGVYGDGQPRSTHTYYRPAAHDGRFWLPGLDSQYVSGNRTSASFSFDTTQTEPATAQWNVHGNLVSSFQSGSGFDQGPTCLDPVSGRLFTAFQFANGQDRDLLELDTAGLVSDGDVTPGNTMNQSRITRWTDYSVGRAWMTVDTDNNQIVQFKNDDSVRTYDLSNMAAGPTVQSVSGSVSSQVRPQSEGGIGHYSPALGGIVAWDEDVGAGVLYFLDTTTWTWSTIITTGSITTPLSNIQGTFGKFNLVQDMGNGESCLVYVNSLSATGINAMRIN